MRPIDPARIVGGAVVAEDRLLSVGLTKVFRGVDFDPPSPAPPAASTLSGSPYRRAVPADPTPVPVIVREVSELAEDDPEVHRLF